jgi:hypothetical protein
MRKHMTSDTNNKNKKQITMLKTSVAVGIQMDDFVVIAVIEDVSGVVC